MDSVDDFLGRLMFLAYSQAHNFVMSKASYPPFFFYFLFFYILFDSRSQCSMEKIIPDLLDKHRKRSRIVNKWKRRTNRIYHSENAEIVCENERTFPTRPIKHTCTSAVET